MPLPVCRVCLSSNIAPSEIDIQLRDVYEKLTGSQFNSEDDVSRLLCHYCSWQLQRCCKLTATAVNSDKILRKTLHHNTKDGLKIINSLPKSRHLTITKLKSLSFNGESKENSFEYPKLMMSGKDLSKPVLGSLSDGIRGKPALTSVIKTLAVTKSLNKPSDMKQYGPITKQLSLRCLLAGNPGLVITKRKKPVVTGNNKIIKQETIETNVVKQEKLETINETADKIGEIQYETKKQDLGTGINTTKEHEMSIKSVDESNQTGKDEIFDDNSQTVERNQPIFYSCDICEELYKTKELLNQHQKTHYVCEDIRKKKKPKLCLICNKYVMSMSSHRIVHRDRRYVCDICGHMSRTKDHLTTHMRKHMDVPEIVCKVCNKGFKYKSSYIYHKNIHTGERPFSCHICGGTYKQSGQVRAHIRYVHEGLRRFSCDLCGKKFPNKDKLSIHLNSHYNINPFSCEKCKKAFRTSSAMRRHAAKYCKMNKQL